MDTEQLWDAVQKLNGKRRTRTMDREWFDFALAQLAEHKDDPKAKRIRIYPGPNSFVANAYAKQGRAVVTTVEFNRDEAGEWQGAAFLANATRSHGYGSYVTVNGHATK
jgi:hypothetical protein